MAQIPHHVVLSPHPDDAVLSLGACMAAWRRAGDRVTVMTVFDGAAEGPLTVAAQEDRARYVSDPVVLRKVEDARAVSLFNADLISLDLPELVYRRRADGTDRCDGLASIFGPIVPVDDEAVIENVAVRLRDVLPSEATVHVPLGTGGHVDHRIVRVAAARVLASFESYDDLPYAIREGVNDATILWPTLVERDLDAWISAIRAYESQVPILFETTPDWPAAFRAFAATKASIS